MSASKREAEAALKQMKRSLRAWLKYRQKLDDYAAGRVEAPVLFRRAKPLPPQVVRATLRSERFEGEQDLANTLRGLLIETGCPISLPSSDVRRDPDAAVKLARIAIAGKCPGEAPAQGMGIVWFALAIPVAGIVLVISQFIKSRADVEKERERLRCIQAGACTDAGFWLKVGAVATVSWLAWAKLGLREVVEKQKRRI